MSERSLFTGDLHMTFLILIVPCELIEGVGTWMPQPDGFTTASAFELSEVSAAFSLGLQSFTGVG